MHQTSALLLRRYRFSETSLIIVWFTEAHGKVKTMARGGLKTGSSFAGRLELFSEAEIYFKLNKKSDLHLLQEVVPLQQASSVASNYLVLLCASYFSELCDLLTESMYSEPEIFSLLKRAFTFLEREQPTLRVLYHFETELAKILGIYDPEASADHSLGKSIHHLPVNRALLLERLRH